MPSSCARDTNSIYLLPLYCSVLFCFSSRYRLGSISNTMVLFVHTACSRDSSFRRFRAMAAAPRVVTAKPASIVNQCFRSHKTRIHLMLNFNSSRCTSMHPASIHPLYHFLPRLEAEDCRTVPLVFSLRTCCESPLSATHPGLRALTPNPGSAARARRATAMCRFKAAIFGSTPPCGGHSYDDGCIKLAVGNGEDSNVKVKSCTRQTNRLPVFLDPRPERFVIHIHVF